MKNGFVAAALVFAGRFLHLDSVLRSLLALGAFCLASSFVYVINDWLDREKDRRHPIKRHRPIASGEVSASQALWIAGLLLAGALLLVIWLPPLCSLTVLGYMLLNLSYSLWLKHMVILDVFSIALSFALRVVGGGTAIEVPLSPWVLLCTMGLALFLAAAKRRQELVLMETEAGETRKILSQYGTGYLDKLMLLSANLAVISYSLFALAVRPTLAWGLPFVLYGIFRYYFIMERKGMGESPTDTLFQDRPLLIAIISWALLNVALILWTE